MIEEIYIACSDVRGQLQHPKLLARNSELRAVKSQAKSNKPLSTTTRPKNTCDKREALQGHWYQAARKSCKKAQHRFLKPSSHLKSRGWRWTCPSRLARGTEGYCMYPIPQSFVCFVLVLCGVLGGFGAEPFYAQRVASKYYEIPSAGWRNCLVQCLRNRCHSVNKALAP